MIFVCKFSGFMSGNGRIDSCTVYGFMFVPTFRMMCPPECYSVTLKIKAAPSSKTLGTN